MLACTARYIMSDGLHFMTFNQYEGRIREVCGYLRSVYTRVHVVRVAHCAAQVWSVKKATRRLKWIR